MKTKKILASIGLLLFFIMLFITACKKDVSISNSTGARSVSVYLTDDPAMYDSVLIDIQKVEVKVDTSHHKDDDHFGDNDHDTDDHHQHHDGFGQWVDLEMTPGVYNISELRNGIDTLLASGEIDGKIRKIRITLGTENTIYVDGTAHTLSLLPGVNNYLYVKIHDDDIQGDNDHHSIWVDFDINRSIVRAGGQYYLKPFLRPFAETKSGKVEGKAGPSDARIVISLFNETDTVNAIPGHHGEYKIRGLKQGTYSITFNGFNGYNDTTLNNIVVTKGKPTKIETITLHK